ncbi:MITOGEN-ACTIVATED KINASE KINASE KINASE [Salix viminalis]|uniref:mitogen-activated protein kinase kinase n=1 Tax=Salix viminalis TaxID=40686 RepID=A0A9Q0SGR7_SALVM|nr:MITOGEN-ACTIVATED KINASE KINASE KINASE [Salix viminalis]
MALVRERRQINLRLPELSDRRPRFPLPLPPASSTTTTTTTTTSTSAISCNDIEKIHVIGHGNGGTVYKVRHKRTSQIYALKVVHGDSDPLVRRQIYREIEILRRTDSPYIVQCHGSYEKPSGDIVIVMEYMELATLDSLLQKYGTFDEPKLSHVARQVLSGLIPDTYGGNYDGYAGDIWSLGLTLLELYLGHFPFLPPGQRPDWATLMCAICFGDPPSLPDGASEEFRDFIQCCLQKESSKRWTTSQLLSHPFVCKDPSSDLLSL